MEEIRERIAVVKQDIEKNKICDDVVLVGATKTRSIIEIEEAVEAGLKVAGENRVQELIGKYKITLCA